jgi:RimJ/RimL family protein N-acetyltransferase
MKKIRVIVTELQRGDLSFLIDLWHNADVMRYADEFPRLRGWSKNDDLQTAWQRYRKRRAELGSGYVQLILQLEDGTLIGESFFAPLLEGYTFGSWRKPDDVVCSMGDIKLLPIYWGQGLGTEGMRRVVEFLFANTGCQLLTVPPHRQNPAAVRVYEKTGFLPVKERRSWHGHEIMELSKTRFQKISKEPRSKLRGIKDKNLKV